MLMPKERISRRAVIATAALVPVSAVRSAAASADSVFSAAQRMTLEAFMDRLVPEDENGPGAVACGAANYIDRSLGDFLAAEKTSFLSGLDAVDRHARTTFGAAFADVAPDRQDEIMRAIERDNRAFFERARRLTIEGMMSDPHYGGNTNYAGWDLIRYPGPRLAVGEADQKIKDAIRPVRASAYGHGH